MNKVLTLIRWYGCLCNTAHTLHLSTSQHPSKGRRVGGKEEQECPISTHSSA